MTLSQTPGTGMVTGFYSSSTGSTGIYRVVGFSNINKPVTPQWGESVALNVFWHSIVGPADPSWHYVSALAGQASVVDGAVNLLLNHNLVASTPFPQLCGIGAFQDKLVFVPTTTQVSINPPIVTRPFVRDVSTGTWQSLEDPGLTIEIASTYPGAGAIVGGVRLNDSTFLSLQGFTDTYAVDDNLLLQSVALSFIDFNTGVARAWAGTINSLTGVMSLLAFDATATAPGSTYVQTAARGYTFKRITKLRAAN